MNTKRESKKRWRVKSEMGSTQEGVEEIREGFMVEEETDRHLRGWEDLDMQN